MWPYPSLHGGVQRVGSDLYHEHKRLGHDVKVIVPGNAQLRDIPEEDVIRIGVSLIKRFPANHSRVPWNISFRPYQIAKMFRKEKFDIIHFHNTDIGIWVLEFLWVSYLMRRWPPSRPLLKILTFHGAMDASKWQKPLPYMLRWLFMPHFDGATATSEASLQVLEKWPGLRVIVHNGVDLDRFTLDLPDPEMYRGSLEYNSFVNLLNKFQDGRYNIFFTGRHERRKGLIQALQAYEIVCQSRSDVRLVIAGDGEMRKEAEVYAREHGIPEVHFIGWVPEPLLPHFYALAYMLLAPALFGESFGLVLLEAMACGTVPLGFANNGYQYLLHLKNLDKDLLVEPGNSSALAEKIRILLENPDEYERLKRAGSDFCKQFAIPLTTGEFLNLYEEAQKKKSKKKSLVKRLFAKLTRKGW